MFGNDCVKCGRPAVVHLTEITKADDGTKKIIQVDLCLEHAVQGGMVGAIPVSGKVPPGVVSTKSPVLPKAGSKSGSQSGTGSGTGFHGGGSSAKEPVPSAVACPNCGITWDEFIKCGLMGCPNDYTFFEAEILDLVKTAHEGASQAVGKTPAGLTDGEAARRASIARLEHQLAQALAAEKYEQAAQLRDQINAATQAGAARRE